MADYSLVRLVYQQVIVGLEFVLFSLILKKYREKRSTTTLYLTTGIFCLSILSFFQSIGYYLQAIESEVVISEAFMFLLLIVANFFVLLFVCDVFHNLPDNPAAKRGIIVYLLMAGGYLAYNVITGGFSTFAADSISLGILMLLVMAVAFIYASDAIVMSKKLQEPIDKRASLIMAFSPLLFFVTFICSILDRLQLFEFPVFDLVGWLLGAVSVFCAYVGYLRPEWFKKRYEKGTRGE